MRKLVQKILNKYGYHLVKFDKNSPPWDHPVDFDDELRDILSRVKPYTMTLPERVYANCTAVRYLCDNAIEGDLVECGVWRGGSTMAMLYSLMNRNALDRNMYMYDTYEGMSEPGDDDKAFFGDGADKLMKSSDKHDPSSVWCYASLSDVQKNVLSTGYPKQNIHFIKGKVENTIPDTIPEKIALLRLDTDWYESTKHELEYLFPRLVSGGVLIIDDYGHWHGARKAVDEYINQNKLKLLLNRTDYSGRIAVKI